MAKKTAKKRTKKAARRTATKDVAVQVIGNQVGELTEIQLVIPRARKIGCDTYTIRRRGADGRIRRNSVTGTRRFG